MNIPEFLIRSQDWVLGETTDDTEDENSKTVTVPHRRYWYPYLLFVKYVANATAGERRLEYQFLDPDDNIITKYQVGAVQAEDTTYYYNIGIGMPKDDAVVGDTLGCPLQAVGQLDQGYQIKVLDVNDIDSDDDMVLTVRYGVRQV